MEILIDNILIGTLNGTVVDIDNLETDGVIGNALPLDGSDHKVDLGNQRHTCLGSLHLCTKGLTIAFWVKVGASTKTLQYIIHSGGENQDSHGFQIYYDGGDESIRMRFRRLLDPSADGGILSEVIYPLARHEWHHVAATWKPNDYTILYIDGDKKVEGAGVPAPANHNPLYNTVTIGKKNWDDQGRRFTGTLDEIMVFYAVKDANQIITLYEMYI